MYDVDLDLKFGKSNYYLVYVTLYCQAMVGDTTKRKYGPEKWKLTFFTALLTLIKNKPPVRRSVNRNGIGYSDAENWNFLSIISNRIRRNLSVNAILK